MITYGNAHPKIGQVLQRPTGEHGQICTSSTIRRVMRLFWQNPRRSTANGRSRPCSGRSEFERAVALPALRAFANPRRILFGIDYQYIPPARGADAGVADRENPAEMGGWRESSSVAVGISSDVHFKTATFELHIGDLLIVSSFADGQPQRDDMTLVIMKVRRGM